MRSRLVTGLVALIFFAGAGAAIAGFNKAVSSAGLVSSATLAAPTGLTATGTGPITLSWTATASSYATGTRVLRSTTSGSGYAQIAQITPRTTTTYVDTPPGPGTYYYVVVAYYQQWTSGNSTQASATRVAITLVQKTSGGGSSGTFTASFTAAPVAGDLLVAVASTRNLGTYSAVSAGWSIAIDSSGTSPGQVIYYKIAGAAEPVLFTVTTSGSGTGNGIQLYEYSGATTLSGTGTATAAGTLVGSGSVTVTAPYSVTIAALADLQGASYSGWTNSFVEELDYTQGAGGGRTLFGGADVVQTSAGTFSTSATSTASGNSTGQIVAFS